MLDATHHAVIREEEALLARARDAIDHARRAPAAAGGLRDDDELRALREQAVAAPADDLPGVLHEMSVRHRLRERAPDAALPDPRSPYVAHLRIEDARGVRDYLLGHGSLIDATRDVRIVDWRTAPIAQVFYRYREGDEYEEEVAGRTIEGRVLARRVVVIDDGVLVRVVGDEGLSLARGAGGWTADALAGLTTGGAGTAPRGNVLGVGVGARDRAAHVDVTALLDREQHDAIALPADRPLLVIGSAGSGKTTVAMHRFARVAATDPSRFAIDRMRVVVPEEGLARLSRRLLAPLAAPGDEDLAADVRTIDEWALESARAAFGSVPRMGDETPAVVARLKRHPALFDALRTRFRRVSPERTANVRRLRTLLAEPLSDRAFLGTVVDASRGDLPRHAVEETLRHTMRQHADSVDRQLASITDEHRKQAIDGRDVGAGTPEATAGSIDPEDLPLFLWLRALSGTRPPGARVTHLVVDEAEDVSLFELAVLGTQLDRPPSLTLAGDDVQRTGGGFGGWQRALGVLGARGAETVRLSVSYRCPRPIVALAQRVLGAQAPESPARPAREGAPVARLELQTEAHALLVLASTLRDLIESEPRASIAVIAEDEESASRVARALADVPGARRVEHGAFSFEPGIDVTHVDDVKGLEWDYVVIPDATAARYPDEPEARRRLHVAITRASWQLCVVSYGRASPLLT